MADKTSKLNMQSQEQGNFIRAVCLGNERIQLIVYEHNSISSVD